jgi:hypothetical protein
MAKAGKAEVLIGSDEGVRMYPRARPRFRDEKLRGTGIIDCAQW